MSQEQNATWPDMATVELIKALNETMRIAMEAGSQCMDGSKEYAAWSRVCLAASACIVRLTTPCALIEVAADDGGWIRHDPKGPIPKTVNAVRFRDGVERRGFRAKCWTEDCFAGSWKHKSGSTDCHITHYKP